MSLKHPHHKLYNKNNAQGIPLLVVIFITISLVLCSVLFNVGNKFFLQTITNIEKEFGSMLSWSDIYINSKGSLIVKNIFLHKELKKNTIDDEINAKTTIKTRKVFFSKTLEVTLDPILLVKYLFSTFNQLPEYDQKQLELLKKEKFYYFRYIATKSIKQVKLTDIESYILLPNDASMLRYLQEKFFTKKIFPQNATVILNNIQGRLDGNFGVLSTHSFNVEFLLSTVQGMSMRYSGNIGISKLSQHIQSDVEGYLTSDDFFNSIIMRTMVENMDINNYITVTPAIILLEKSNNNFIFNVDWEQTDASIVGSMVNKEIDIAIDIDQVKISSLLQSEEKSMFSYILDDILVGTGRFRKNLSTNVTDYQLVVKNINNDIDIDIQGDENHIQFHNFSLHLNNQFFDINGDLSFLDWGMNGSVDLELHEPIVNVPVKGSFLFVNTPYSSFGKTVFLKVNDTPQKNMNIEYSWIDKYFLFFLEGVDFPVLNIQREVGIDNYEISIHEFPLEFVKSYMNINSIGVLSDTVVNADIIIEHTNESGRNIIYNTSLKNLNNDYDYFHISGEYLDKQLQIYQGSEINIGEKMRGEVSGILSFDSWYQDNEFTNVRLFFDNALMEREEYDIRGKISNGNVYQFSINNNFNVEVEFNSKVIRDFSTMRRVSVQSDNFMIPMSDLTIHGTSDAIFSEEGFQSLAFDFSAFYTDTNTVHLSGSYDDRGGDISNLYWKNNDRIFEGVGSIISNPANSLLQLKILEVPNLDSSSIGLMTLDAIPSQSLIIEYNTKLNTINAEANNIKLGFFSQNFSGILNAGFLTDIKNQSIYGSIYSSQIVYKSNKYELTTDFGIHGFDTSGDIKINNLHILLDDNELYFSQLSINDFQNINGDFVVKNLSKLNDNPDLFEGYFSLDTEHNFYNMAFKPDGFLNSNFEGEVLLTPVFSEDASVIDRYKYNIDITHIQGKTTIIDTQREIFFVHTNENKLIGTVGNQYSILYANVEGVLSSKNIDIDININNMDYSTFDKEFIKSVNIVGLQDLFLQGKISLKGKILSPTYYGFIQIKYLKAYIAYFNKDLVFPNINILISENEVSIVNSIIELDNDYLIFNAQGRLHNFGLETIQIDIFTQDNRYFDFRKIRFGKLMVNGEIQGKVTVLLEQDDMNITGVVSLNNALLSNERKTQRQLKTEVELREKSKNLLFITADILTTTQSGVVFMWPTSSFPILKAGFAKNQKMSITYDGELNEYIAIGDIFFDSGIIYYLDKGFDISQLHVRFDEYNGLLNPFVNSLEAIIRERYNNHNYTITLSSEFTALKDMKVNITTDPLLTADNISSMLGDGILSDSTTDTVSSSGLLSTIVKLSDPISNIGFFSQFENILQRSLKLDYLSFKTKLVQNLFKYSLENSTNTNIVENNEVLQSNSNFLPYIFDQSSLEIGKYIDILYLNLQLELDAVNFMNNISTIQYSDAINLIPIKTTFNVELPTPFFDLKWTVSPVLSEIQKEYVPMNLLTISWQKKF